MSDKYKHLKPDRPRTCFNAVGQQKTRFLSRAEAEKHAASRDSDQVVAYRCRACAGFHVGKRRGIV
jgi:hypothetical protein